MDEAALRAMAAAQLSPSNKINVVSRQSHIDAANDDSVLKMDAQNSMPDPKRNKMSDS